MQRQRGELVPVAEVLSGLDGPVAAIRDTSPQALHHFTRFDQVNQLVSASEAAPAAGLSRRKASARTLCSPSASVTGPCPLSALPVTGAGGAVPPALVCWFSLCLVKGKHIRPFQQGGNTQWLTQPLTARRIGG